METTAQIAEQLRGGGVGGESTQFALYPGGTASPDGLTLWVLGDAVVGLEIRRLRPPADAPDDLGPAPAVISSDLGRARRQELWSERGLVLHRRGDEIAVALGLSPFDPDSWESGSLRRWGSERRLSR
ncbi:hypothetical protein GCM10022204_01290 [Microlunatus aurantiacus]|uniref:Uncharacterized protein n=1 Tax=Microlunatus aurantiacus TaxID=446786 RepID=A0ABP7CGN3_9ACTN